MKRTILFQLVCLCVLLISSQAYGQYDIYVLSGNDAAAESIIDTILTNRGHNVTIGAQTHLFDGTQATLSDFDVVVISNSVNWSAGSMPVAGQNALIAYVNGGGGLVTGEWLVWNIDLGGRHTGLSAIMPATAVAYSSSASTTYSATTSHAILNQGLPASFLFSKGSVAGTETHLTAKASAAVFYDSSSTGLGGVIGGHFGSGKVINFSVLLTTAELSDANFAQLFGNAVDSVAGDVPLPVFLSVFEATISGGQVVLRWQTVGEINNLGFNVYRSESVDGPYIKVNPVLIPGAGTDASPHEYTVIDESTKSGSSYFYYLENIDLIGTRAESHIIGVTVDPRVTLDPERILIPVTLPPKSVLYQNYPNPFNPETWIPYELAQPGEVTLHIHDGVGRLVRSMSLGLKEAGYYLERSRAIHWDGRNQAGEAVSSGTYYYVITVGDFTATRRMVILK